MYKIGFIGLGKLGIPCSQVFLDKGYDVIGYDIEHREGIETKESIKSCVEDRDIVFIAVPTPHEKEYDGSEPTSHLIPRDFYYDYIKLVLVEADKYMNSNQVLVLISTVLPGTIRKELSPLLKNTNLIYNPYLIAQGTVKEDMINPEMIILGGEISFTKSSYYGIVLTTLYDDICGKKVRYEMGTWEEAECIKMFYNTFITQKINFVNMIRDVSAKLDYANPNVIADALAKSTMRIMSERYMKPGMGDGGSCHPRDNIALRWLSKKLDLDYDMFGDTMKIREKQAFIRAKEILKLGNKVYFSSDSFKENVDCTDGSYSLLIQHYVKKLGGQITNSDDCDVFVKVHQGDNVSRYDLFKKHIYDILA